MSQKVTLGGDRLGSGKKQKVELHGYERSNHDLSYLWRSTISPGTLVPFLTELALPGDTFDISLEAETLTHPTVGPLFASFKQQFDIFQIPIRLYIRALHNNKVGIGLKMQNVFLPQLRLNARPASTDDTIPGTDIDNSQINPSSLLAYLNIRGIGYNSDVEDHTRLFNAIPLLGYWDIYKNYYSNKQEEIGYAIYTDPVAAYSITGITVNGVALDGSTDIPVNDSVQVIIDTTPSTSAQVASALWQYVVNTPQGQLSLQYLLYNITTPDGTHVVAQWNYPKTGQTSARNWDYIGTNQNPQNGITLDSFPLISIDDMREAILGADTTVPFIVNDNMVDGDPFWLTLDAGTDAIKQGYEFSQQGLGVKTYQSDLFNNWLNTDDITGSGGINDVTKIITTSGSFTLDTLLINKKLYDFLNRISVSGGTYDDWLDATWDDDRYTRAETPVYHGGMAKEVVFQEVVSMAQAAASGTAQTNQPLGTLGGRGKHSQKKKGGKVTIRVNEPSYIMGITSLTPRLDYSQGNKWDTHLETMDDLHKPALDEIGFQDLLTEQMAWFGTRWDSGGGGQWQTLSAGKQPAWINYMTNVNQTRGNFAILENEMFMTLNRKYQSNANDGIGDVTTYIDPAKYNNVFAQTSLDAQNFWAQIAINMHVRRKISAKIMPNL